jgi:hypothetical protein
VFYFFIIFLGKDPPGNGEKDYRRLSPVGYTQQP